MRRSTCDENGARSSQSREFQLEAVSQPEEPQSSLGEGSDFPIIIVSDLECLDLLHSKADRHKAVFVKDKGVRVPRMRATIWPTPLTHIESVY